MFRVSQGPRRGKRARRGGSLLASWWICVDELPDRGAAVSIVRPNITRGVVRCRNLSWKKVWDRRPEPKGRLTGQILHIIHVDSPRWHQKTYRSPNKRLYCRFRLDSILSECWGAIDAQCSPYLSRRMSNLTSQIAWWAYNNPQVSTLAE